MTSAVLTGISFSLRWMEGEELTFPVAPVVSAQCSGNFSRSLSSFCTSDLSFDDLCVCVRERERESEWVSE